MPLISPEIYEPTQVRYLDWYGPRECFWNFDAVPPGEWHIETSKDLVKWEEVQGVAVHFLRGSSCLTWNLSPDLGFARIRRVKPPNA